MLNLLSTDILEVITGAATNVDVVVSYMDASMADPPVVKGTTSGRQVTAITTAVTTTVCAAPAASHIRNVKSIRIRNKSTGTSNDITVQQDVSGTNYELVKVTLKPGEALTFMSDIGWVVTPATNTSLHVESVAQQSGFSADTYLTGSFVLFPSGAPLAGTYYRLRFDVTKTAAGTAAAALTIRVGTAGTTSDTGRLTITWGAQTAAADAGVFTVDVAFRTVGSGTAATIIGRGHLVNNLASTGLSNITKTVVPAVSGGFDSTVAGLGIGASWNGGASAAHTIQLVSGELTV